MKYIVSLNGKDYEVEVEHGQAVMVNVSDTTATPAAFPAAPAPAAAQEPAAAQAEEAPAAVEVSDPAPAAASAGEEVINAPMPGTVLSITTRVGAKVVRGDVLLILEAMKMENEIVAPREGIVTRIEASAGDMVDTGDVLVAIS